ncbi:hypothetical protein Fot_54602 [Forsythia ovata]|uniref:Uncharacterized protein n=1 Tax=Forsythia ovata TaxID=205694 RepID=A0ABD1P7K6_9LAMI
MNALFIKHDHVREAEICFLHQWAASLSLAVEAFEEHDKGVNNEGIGLGSDNNGGYYVPTIQCSSEMKVDEDNIAEYIFHQKDIWSQLEESLVYNDLSTDAGNQIPHSA